MEFSFHRGLLKLLKAISEFKTLISKLVVQTWEISKGLKDTYSTSPSMPSIPNCSVRILVISFLISCLSSSDAPLSISLLDSVIKGFA